MVKLKKLRAIAFSTVPLPLKFGAGWREFFPVSCSSPLLLICLPMQLLAPNSQILDMKLAAVINSLWFIWFNRNKIRFDNKAFNLWSISNMIVAAVSLSDNFSFQGLLLPLLAR